MMQRSQSYAYMFTFQKYSDYKIRITFKSVYYILCCQDTKKYKMH